MPLRRISVLSALCVAAALSSSLPAAVPTVIPGASNFLPETPGQQLQLFVNGTDLVVGEDLYIQINTNEDLSLPNFSGVPTFSGIDIITGAIFAASNTGQNNFGDDDGIIEAGTISSHLAIVATTTVEPQTVLADGLLATLTLDTTGITSGVFQVRLLNTLNDDSFLVLPDGSKLFPSTCIHNNTQNVNALLITVGDPARRWAFNGSGDWSLNANWSPFAPYVAGDRVGFLDAVDAGNAIVSLNGDRTAGELTFNNTSASYTLAQGAAGSLILDNRGTPASIANLGGSHTLAAPLVLTASTTVHVAGVSDVLIFAREITGPACALNITGYGSVHLSGTVPSILADVSLATASNGGGTVYTPTLDITDSALIIQAVDPADRNAKIAALQAAIACGFNGGTWTGTGITSSTVALDSAALDIGVFDNAILGLTTCNGINVDAQSVILAVAHKGDASCDAVVDIVDLAIVANNWQQPRDNWAAGDLNRDGIVDIIDLAIVANNWQHIGEVSPPAVASAALTAAVPEPASLIILALGAAALRQRRRR